MRRCSVTAGYCAHRPGGCPLCDPRPITADRDAGCTCPPGRRGVPLHLDDWRPAPGCPVHVDLAPAPLHVDDVDQLFAPPLEQVPDVVVRWDDDTRALIAALYGEAFVDQLEADATTYARDQLAGAQTPGPGAPPETAHRGEDAGDPLAGGPGRAHPDEATR